MIVVRAISLLYSISVKYLTLTRNIHVHFAKEYKAIKQTQAANRQCRSDLQCVHDDSTGPPEVKQHPTIQSILTLYNHKGTKVV